MNENHLAGALLGLACGDALGAPAEFYSPPEMQDRFGYLTEMVGGGQWQPGEWTDDTGMALCMADGILANPKNPVTEVGQRFLTWRKTAKDVGTTIAAALANYRGDWAEAARSTPHAQRGMAAGNGSLMRTLPVALAYSDPAQMLPMAARLSAMTHWDPQAETCCQIYCLWIRELLNGHSLPSAWQSALKQAKRISAEGKAAPNTPGPVPLSSLLWPRLESIGQKTYDQLQPSGYAGYVVECLEAAVWCCLHAESAEQAITQAVNLAGEADTIAAVAGGAAGAFWGAAALPARWLDVLHQRERLTETAQGLGRLRRHLEVYAAPTLKPLTYTQVLPRLYIGRNPLTAYDVHLLKELGITHFLDLRQESEWTAPGKYGQEAIAAIAQAGLCRRHVPIPDVCAPTPAALDATSAFLTEALADPAAQVYVHCRAGRERTGAVLTAYYAHTHGASCAEALTALQQLSPQIMPLPHQLTAVQQWLKAGSQKNEK